MEIHDKNLTPTRDQKTNKKKPLQKILKQQQQQQTQMLTCFKSTTISRWNKLLLSSGVNETVSAKNTVKRINQIRIEFDWIWAAVIPAQSRRSPVGSW